MTAERFRIFVRKDREQLNALFDFNKTDDVGLPVIHAEGGRWLINLPGPTDQAGAATDEIGMCPTTVALRISAVRGWRKVPGAAPVTRRCTQRELRLCEKESFDDG